MLAYGYDTVRYIMMNKPAIPEGATGWSGAEIFAAGLLFMVVFNHLVQRYSLKKHTQETNEKLHGLKLSIDYLRNKRKEESERIRVEQIVKAQKGKK